MKVGIITYHYYYNYGTMLQAYALQEAIERRGCEVKILNYRKPAFIPGLFFRIKRLPANILDIRRIFTLRKYKKPLAQKNPYFEKFADDYFKQTRTIFHNIDDFNSYSEEYDLYVTGSDQTFSPKIGLNPCILLDFVMDKDKKVAYAPSIGSIDFTPEQLDLFKRYINSYKFLSCREASGAEFMQPLTDRKVETVLDPTFLLSKEDWSQIATEPLIDKPYIFCYFLGHRKHYESAVKQLQKETGYTVVYIPIDYHDMSPKRNCLWNCGPKEWLSLIKNAAIVCTDSFHGMCFSINFQKDFYVFNKCEGGINSGDNSRIYDLLHRVGLVNRFVDINTKIEYRQINYARPNELLQAERNNSTAYLNKILG